MLANPNQVIVTAEGFPDSSHRITYTHHRAFPEVRGEGDSPEAAAIHLADRLALTLDHAPSHWRHDGICQAIEDVQAFARESRRSQVDAPGRR